MLTLHRILAFDQCTAQEIECRTWYGCSLKPFQNPTKCNIKSAISFDYCPQLSKLLSSEILQKEFQILKSHSETSAYTAVVVGFSKPLHTWEWIFGESIFVTYTIKSISVDTLVVYWSWHSLTKWSSADSNLTLDEYFEANDLTRNPLLAVKTVDCQPALSRPEMRCNTLFNEGPVLDFGSCGYENGMGGTS